jgi:hypothetical protein
MPLDDFRRFDTAFHAAVARACGNATLAELYGKVMESLFASADFDELPLGAHEPACRAGRDPLVDRGPPTHRRGNSRGRVAEVMVVRKATWNRSKTR